MDSISRVVGRIEQIRAQIGAPRRGADFRALLDAGIESTADSVQDTASIEAMAVPVGIGSLLFPAQGLSSPAILASDELQEYLAIHGIEERNGYLGDEVEMVAVSGAWDGTARLLRPAAESWEQMRAAAAADGLDLRAIDSYRSYASQERAYQAYLAGEKSANVLPPGHSEHGLGLAVDVTNGHIVGPGDAEWDWLQANARRFGWHPISNESWHWEFRGR